MQLQPKTQPSLLLRLRDPRNAEAWNAFLELYGPMIYALCRRRGLQDADAADVMQDVLRAAAQALPGFRYDPGVGSFRSWLLRVVRSKLCNFLAWRGRQVPAPGGTTFDEALQSLPDRETDAAWEEAWRARAFHWAAERVRIEVAESTWKAFWETAVRARPTAEVAGELSMTPGAVYVARCRVLARLRARIERAGELIESDAHASRRALPA
jgi:RNA polymerase sigma-70 factor (ECF subfamily)